MPHKAGWIAGRDFCLNTLDRSLSLNPFLAELQTRLTTAAQRIDRLLSARAAQPLRPAGLSEELQLWTGCSATAFTPST